MNPLFAWANVIANRCMRVVFATSRGCNDSLNNCSLLSLRGRGQTPPGFGPGVHWLPGRLDYPLRLRGSPAISRLASRPRVFPAQHDYGLPVDVPVATRGVPPQRLRPPSAPLPSGPLKLSHLLLPSLILAATRRTPLQECYGLLLRVPEGALGVAPEDDR